MERRAFVFVGLVVFFWGGVVLSAYPVVLRAFFSLCAQGSLLVRHKNGVTHVSSRIDCKQMVVWADSGQVRRQHLGLAFHFVDEAALGARDLCGSEMLSDLLTCSDSCPLGTLASHSLTLI